jgi:hypothetical protein
MGIKEMFRDCQTGGYNIEGTGLRGDRLIKMILLMTIADSSAIFQGTEMSEKAGAKICISPKRAEKKVPKTQYIWHGEDGEKWASYLEQHCEAVEELMKLTPNKRRFYLQGIRAATLMRSTL